MGGTVFIRQGKGKRDRIVPIGARALRWVDRYLEEVRPSYVVNEAVETLFLSETGTAISVDTLSNRVARYVTAADIERRGSCHLFRHTVATLMLEAGADVRIIQELLGHASLESTGDLHARVDPAPHRGACGDAPGRAWAWRCGDVAGADVGTEREWRGGEPAHRLSCRSARRARCGLRQGRQPEPMGYNRGRWR
ncbi:MAG: tyrosine-type recombinase/integrase [Polyangiaceae bacterium]|nr:tyrosine-type recombinase/integrase [Polyangiaceae bacterium]